MYKNRPNVAHLIVKYFEAFELALSGKSGGSNSPGVFCGLVTLVATLDEIFENEFLECMLAIIRGHIQGEVKSAKFVTIKADETTVMNAKLSPVVEKRSLN